MVHEFAEDGVSLRGSVRLSSEHTSKQPLPGHVDRPLDGLFALADQGGRVLSNDWLPHWDLGRVCVDFSVGAFEFFDDSMRRNVAELWIDRAEAGMLTHEDLATGAGDHRTCRHCDLRDNGSYVRTEHRVQIINYGFCSSRFSSRCMQDEIQSLRTIQLVNSCHESVLVSIADVGPGHSRLLEPPRIVHDHVTAAQPVQLGQVLTPYYVVSTTTLPDVFENAVPARHCFVPLREWSTTRCG